MTTREACDMKPEPRTPVSLADFGRWKGEGRKLSMLTAYDFTDGAAPGRRRG